MLLIPLRNWLPTNLGSNWYGACNISAQTGVQGIKFQNVGDQNAEEISDQEPRCREEGFAGYEEETSRYFGL
jgi:hypothetical protein